MMMKTVVVELALAVVAHDDGMELVIYKVTAAAVTYRPGCLVLPADTCLEAIITRTSDAVDTASHRLQRPSTARHSGID